MPRLALTDRLIPSLRPAGRAVYFDSKTRGLALRVTPNSVRTWTFVYRSAGKPQWLTLGAYPAVTLADLRVLALDKRHAIDVEKRDPVSELRAEREVARQPPPAPQPVFTFADLARLYEAFAKGKKKTWRDDIARSSTPTRPRA